MLTLQYTIYRDLIDADPNAGIMKEFNIIHTKKSLIFETIPGVSQLPLSTVRKVIPGGKFQMCGYETGGGKSSSGYVCITCSTNGRKLTPNHIFSGYAEGPGSIAKHASFVEESLAQIYIYRQRRTFSCYVYLCKFLGHEINSALVYAVERVGEQNIKVPPEFAEALRAAIDKSYIYHCNEAKFIVSK